MPVILDAGHRHGLGRGAGDGAGLRRGAAGLGGHPGAGPGADGRGDAARGRRRAGWRGGPGAVPAPALRRRRAIARLRIDPALTPHRRRPAGSAGDPGTCGVTARRLVPSGHDRCGTRSSGRLLDGRYRVDARIARGGMATVYRALDTRLDRVVAAQGDAPGARRATPRSSSASSARPSPWPGCRTPTWSPCSTRAPTAATSILAMEYVPGQHPARRAARRGARCARARRWTSWSRCSPRSAPRTEPGSCTAT